MMPFHFHLSCLPLFQIEIEVAKDIDVHLGYLRHHMPSSAHCFFWRANIHFQSRTYIYLQHDNSYDLLTMIRIIIGNIIRMIVVMTIVTIIIMEMKVA